MVDFNDSLLTYLYGWAATLIVSVLLLAKPKWRPAGVGLLLLAGVEFIAMVVFVFAVLAPTLA